jgi:hypothetical protein
MAVFSTLALLSTAGYSKVTLSIQNVDGTAETLVPVQSIEIDKSSKDFQFVVNKTIPVSLGKQFTSTLDVMLSLANNPKGIQDLRLEGLAEDFLKIQDRAAILVEQCQQANTEAAQIKCDREMLALRNHVAQLMKPYIKNSASDDAQIVKQIAENKSDFLEILNHINKDHETVFTLKAKGLLGSPIYSVDTYQVILGTKSESKDLFDKNYGVLTETLFRSFDRTFEE